MFSVGSEVGILKESPSAEVGEMRTKDKTEARMAAGINHCPSRSGGVTSVTAKSLEADSHPGCILA